MLDDDLRCLRLARFCVDEMSCSCDPNLDWRVNKNIQKLSRTSNKLNYNYWGFQDLDFCGGMHLCIFHHLPSFFAFCSFTSVWRGAMLEEIPKPMFSFKADTWRRYSNTFTSRGTAKALKLGTCVERSSPKRRCSLFRSSISWTKRSFQEVCPGLCQEIGDSIFSRLNRLFQIVLA